MWAIFPFLFWGFHCQSTSRYYFAVLMFVTCCWDIADLEMLPKSCQRSIWFLGGQQSKHEHSIINKKGSDWQGQARHVTAWRAFRVASYLLKEVQLSLIPKRLCRPLPRLGSSLYDPTHSHPGTSTRRLLDLPCCFLFCPFVTFRKVPLGKN